MGSDYLAGGSYIVIGTEVLIDVNLIDVETGKVISFSNRGNSEDIIHMAAEKIARELTGKRHIFRTENSDKPIIKAALLPPGTLKLFSPLTRARIYIDGEFYGYTLGTSTTAVEVELPPGPHTVSTDLGREFGVIIEPEILFRKWEKAFTIESGKTVVLEDPTRHFNDKLSRIHRIAYENKTFYDEEPYSAQHDFSFTDRSGQPVKGSMTIYLSQTDDGGMNAEVQFFYNYEREVYTLTCEAGRSREFEKTLGFVDLEIDLSCRYSGKPSASWSLTRNDVYQGMYRE